MSTLCAPVKLPLNRASPMFQASDRDHLEPGIRKPMRLRQAQVVSFDLSAAESRILTAYAGQLWVTMEGDATDYVLNPGESRHFRHPGRVVVEALAESEFAWDKA
jgi:hypothetical protein